MPSAPTYPGVYIEELPSSVRPIAGVATSVALFIGWAAQGPVDRVERLTSFADFERTYGGLDIRSLLGYSVRHFFENGGEEACVLRIAMTDSPTASENASTASASRGDLTISASSPGAWANRHRIRLVQSTDSPERFGIDVLHAPSGNGVVEAFDDLTMAPGDARYAAAVVNGRSRLIKVLVSGSSPPTDVTLDWSSPTHAGSDGLAIGPSHASFQAATLAAFEAGGAIDTIDHFSLLCVPGLTAPDTIRALQARCRHRRAFMIVDCEQGETVGHALLSIGNIAGAGATNAACYFPWVRAADPLQPGLARSFPPCGFVAGIFARTDRNRGVWKAPAGTEAMLRGAQGLDLSLSDREMSQLNAQAINGLRARPGRGSLVWGARTLAGNQHGASEWKYVAVRRLALFLEESLLRGTQWAVFEPNDETLWARIRLNVDAFMNNLFRQGAFQGSRAEHGYFVRCGRETMSEQDIRLGTVNILLGFAPLKPAEFVVIKIQQVTGQIQA